MVQAVKLARFKVRPLMRSYLVLFLMLVTLATGMATGFGLFYRLLYVLVLTTALSYVWTWLAISPISVVVSGRTRQSTVGDDLEETVTVHNRSWLPKFGLEVRDMTTVPGYVGGEAINLWGRSSGSWNLRAQARKRGVYTLGPIRVANTDPFGLFQKEADYGPVETVTVFPRTHDLSSFEVPAAQLAGDASSRKRTYNVTPHASSVREYASGDSLSRVHWNSTAKLGKLMSKEFDLGRAGEVWVLIDLSHNIHFGDLEESTDEYAVSIGASLAKRYLEANQPVGLLAYGDKRYHLPAETGPGQMARVMQYLAVSRPEGYTPLEEALPKDEPLWSHNSSLVVITSSPQPEWVVAVRELSKRGIRTTAVLVDGRSFGGFLNTLEVADPLFLAGIPTYVVRKGDAIGAALSRMYRGETAVPSLQDEEAAVLV